eukprot:365847-Chlamydomonas_euryale.AAC.8
MAAQHWWALQRHHCRHVTASGPVGTCWHRPATAGCHAASRRWTETPRPAGTRKPPKSKSSMFRGVVGWQESAG